MATSPYEKYWVRTKDERMGRVTVYEGLIVEVTENVVELLGIDWHTAMKALRDFSRIN